MTPSRAPYTTLGVAVLLLALAALRAPHFGPLLDLTGDEVWSVWQSSVGGPRTIVARTPFDWPPGYYLLLGGWQALVGSHPVVLRYGMLLAHLVGVAAVYRASLRFYGDVGAGVLAALFYSVSGWALFLSLHLRGHSLTFALAPVMLWLALRYFDHPNWRRGMLLGVGLASMLYIHITVVFFFAALGLFTLVAYGWRVLRGWILPALTLGLQALPEIIHKATLAVESRQNLAVTLPPLGEALWTYFAETGRQAETVWVVLLVVGIGLVLWRERHRPRRVAALAVWLAFPLVLLLPPLRDIFRPRYTSWYLAGTALALGGGYASLPRMARWALVPALLIYGLLPFRITGYDAFAPDVATLLRDLSRAMHAGDVLVVDPNLRNPFGDVPPEEWDLFSDLYFPNGMPFREGSGDARRVWYLRDQSAETDAFREDIAEGRVRRDFFGPTDLFVQLYEAPPDPDGVAFANGMRFHGVDIIEADGGYNTHYLPVFREGTELRLRFWWSVDESPELDYSVGVYITRLDGSLVSSDDTPEPVIMRPGGDPTLTATSQWQPGEFYVTEHVVPITADSAGVRMAVYQWWDSVRVPGEATGEDDALVPFTFHVKAW